MNPLRAPVSATAPVPASLFVIALLAAGTAGGQNICPPLEAWRPVDATGAEAATLSPDGPLFRTPDGWMRPREGDGGGPLAVSRAPARAGGHVLVPRQGGI